MDHLGNLTIGQPFDFTKVKNGPKLRVNSPQRVGKRFSLVYFVLVISIVDGCVVEAAGWMSVLSTKVLQRFIDRQSVHPGLKFRASVEMGHAAKRLEKRLLGDIGCICLSDHAGGESIHHCMARVIELPPCPPVSQATLLHDGGQRVVDDRHDFFSQPIGCSRRHDSS